MKMKIKIDIDPAVSEPEVIIRANVNKVSSFDLSMTGTIQVFFEDGSSTWVARRYVRAVEQRLALPRQKGGAGDE